MLPRENEVALHQTYLVCHLLVTVFSHPVLPLMELM